MDNYPISSTVFSGSRSIFPIKREMEEHADKKLKQLKLMNSVQECAHLSVPENSSPLGLTLRKTPSFLDLVETKLSHSNSSCSEPQKRRKSTEADAVTQQTNGKTKASNFTVSILRIGSWERISRYDGDLVCKCYFAKRRFLWEVLDGRLKNKIEVPWSDIASIKATFKDNASEVLEIELLRRPLFFRETNPQPRKHTLWKSTEDFTGGQASVFRRHKLQFPQGTLQKHYERLLQLDSGLSLLSKKPYPSLDSPFFGPDDVESQNHGIFGLEGDNTDLLNQVLWGSSDDHSEQLQCFTLTRNVPQQYSNPDCIVASYITSSKNSGASRSYLGHGSLNSGSYVLPSVSVPPSTFITTDSSESYRCNANEAVEVITDPFGSNLGVAGLCQAKLSSVVTTNSTLEFKSNCWVSEIYQTDHNLAGALEGSIGRSDMDQYCTEFSQLVEVDDNLHGEMFGDCAEFFANISGSTAFPNNHFRGPAFPNNHFRGPGSIQ